MVFIGSGHDDDNAESLTNSRQECFVAGTCVHYIFTSMVWQVTNGHEDNAAHRLFQNPSISSDV